MQSLQTAHTDRPIQTIFDLPNPKTQDPSGLNSLAKDDAEFHFRSTTQRHLRLLHRFSYAAIAISAYELITSSTSLGLRASSFNVISTIISLISLALSISLTIWSSQALKAEENSFSLNELLNGRWENFHQAFYIGLMFRAMASLPIIANMIFQKSFTSQYLTAQRSSDHNLEVTGHVMETLSASLPIVELLLCLTYLQAARVVFSYVTKPIHSVTKMVFVGNVALIACALSLVVSSRDATNYQNQFDLEAQFPSSVLKTSLLVGSISAALTGLIWLVNHNKWRVPHFTVSGLLALLIFGLAYNSFDSYQHSKEVLKLYQDTSNNYSWRMRMAEIDRNQIEEFGCPSKYNSDSSILGKMLFTPKTADGEPFNHLNIDCAGLLGQFQASPFLSVCNWSLLSLASALIILIGFSFEWRMTFPMEHVRDKRDFKWLGMLGVALLIFGIVMLAKSGRFDAQGHAIMEKVKEMVKEGEGSLRGAVEDIKSSVKEVVKEGEGSLRGAIDEIKTNVNEVVKEGEGGLKGAIDKIKASVTGNEEPKKVEKSEEQQQQGAQTKKETFYTVIEELGDGTNQIPVVNSKTVKGLNMTSPVENNLMFAADATSPFHEGFKNLLYKKYRFLTFKHDPFKPEKVRVLAGPWKLSFENFSNSVEKKKEQAGFVYIDQGGSDKLYFVVFTPEGTDAVSVLEGLHLPIDTTVLKNEGLKDIRSVVFSDVNDIIVENVIAKSRPPGPVVDLPPQAQATPSQLSS